jgi:ribonuclease BN (tRNA processing enzyme)
VLAYTCDTEPTDALYELGLNADILLHVAAGEGLGHSSARQAGETASRTEAKSLYLIHYEVWNKDPAPLVPEAQETFDGPVYRCEDGDEYEF